MSLVDGTDPISRMPDAVADEFSNDKFVSVPLNKEQILREIAIMEMAIQDLPADEESFLEARQNIRANVDAMEKGLVELRQREKAAQAKKDAAEKKKAQRQAAASKKKTPDKPKTTRRRRSSKKPAEEPPEPDTAKLETAEAT